MLYTSTSLNSVLFCSVLFTSFCVPVRHLKAHLLLFPSNEPTQRRPFPLLYCRLYLPVLGSACDNRSTVLICPLGEHSLSLKSNIRLSIKDTPVFFFFQKAKLAGKSNLSYPHAFSLSLRDVHSLLNHAVLENNNGTLDVKKKTRKITDTFIVSKNAKNFSECR